MNDSLEKLALSCTFAVIDGKIGQVEEVGPDSTPSLSPNYIVDRKYRVIELIGEGGMGSVYKVHHELLQKDMALKTICARSLSSEAWQRFQREAQAIAKLRHKNIVEVFDFGIADGQLPYYTMELLEGETLAQRLTRLGPCDTALALNIFIQVAEAMAHAHRLKIVHRDIKPANILLTQSYASKASVQVAGEAPAPVVKIVDFGVSKLATEAPLDDQYLTNAGTVFGSPLYMSPEQSMGAFVDHRSDIYSFGCSLFHTLAGSPPFFGDSALLTLISHQNDTPPSLRAANAACQSTQRLDSILDKLLAKIPDQRFQTFDAVRDELTYCLGALQAKQLTTTPSATDLESIRGGAAWAERRKSAPVSSLKLLLLVAMALSLASAIFLLPRNETKPSALPINGQPSAGVIASRSVKSEPSLAAGTGPYPDTVSKSSEEDTADNAPDFGRINAISEPPFPVQFGNGPSGPTKTYTFPPGQNCANLYFSGRTEPMPCSGNCTVPAAAKLSLVGIQGLAPAFLRRFRSDDLYDLQLKACIDGRWTLEHMEAISHLSGLNVLDISESDLDGRALPYINKLVNLKQLKVAETKIRGDELARLLRLPHLAGLQVSRLDNIRELLKQLPRKCRLGQLIACSDELTDDDMPLIAQLVNLNNLGLSGNNITERGLKSLEPISNLVYLSLDKIGPECIEPLSHFHNLKALRIENRAWSVADKARLQEALPNCKISEDFKGDVH